MSDLANTEILDNEGDLRAILVGVGGYGQVWRGIKNLLPGLQVEAVVDLNSGPLGQMASVFDLPESRQFSSLEQAIADVAADLVIDSTPPQFHLTNAMLSFEHGLHVFTAKPAALCWEDAARMKQAAELAQVVFGVNEQFRYGWISTSLLQVIQMGEIGTVESIEVDFREPSAWQDWRSQMDHPLLLDAAVQHFDMVRAITGLEVQSAFCRAWQDTSGCFNGKGSACAVMDLSGGVPFVYRGSWDARPGSSDCTGWWGNWRIQGSHGSIRAEGKRGIWVNGVPSPAVAQPLDVQHLSIVVLDHFLRAVRTGSLMPTDGESELKTMAFTELCIRSDRTGNVAEASDLKLPEPDLKDGQAPGPGNHLGVG